MLLCSLVWFATAPALPAEDTASSILPTTTLDQLTKDLTLLASKYRQANGAGRTALEADLQRLVRQRATVLKTVLITHPQTALRSANLPAAVVTLLPAALQGDLEHPVTVQGTIEPLDARGGTGTFPYRLRDWRGRMLRLHCVGQAPTFVSGATVSIAGVQLGDDVIFDGGSPEGLRVMSRSTGDTAPPVVTLVEPAAGTYVKGTITTRATASDDQRIEQTSVLKDGVILGSRPGAGYEGTWDTRREADGPHTLQVRAHDINLNAGTSPLATVTVDNTPPRARLSAPRDRDIVSGRITLTAEADDQVGLDAVTFAVDGRSLGMVVQPPYTLAWDTATTSNGVHTVTATATDRAQNATVSAPAEVRVLNANRAPVLEPIGSHTIPEGATLVIPLAAADPDGARDALTFRALHAPAWLQLDAAARHLIGAPGLDDVPPDQTTRVYSDVTIEVCDAQPLCDREMIAITVTNLNRPPIIQPIPDQAASPNQPLTITPTMTDPDGGPLTCRARRLPRWARFTAETCTISGTPPADVASAAEPIVAYRDVELEACDAQGTCVSSLFAIAVAHANHRPSLAAIGDHTVEEAEILTLRLQAADDDNDPLELKLAPLPPGAAFEDAGSGAGVFSWQPREDQAGVYTVTVVASDDQVSDAETFRITVQQTRTAISGKVHDDLDGPVVGVTVEIARAGGREYSVVTDVDGRYLQSGLPKGTYTVRPYFKTGDLPSAEGLHFSPLSQRVDLGEADRTGVDFRALQR